jgi:hypothetical protein
MKTNLLKKGMATIVAILMSVMLSSFVTSCPEGHVPVCPFPDPSSPVFFPHPNNCQWFFHCSDGVAYCKKCPADLYWNVDLNTCDYEYYIDHPCDMNGNEPDPEEPGSWNYDKCLRSGGSFNSTYGVSTVLILDYCPITKSWTKIVIETKECVWSSQSCCVG